MKKVSIIVTVYNVQDYLPKCIDSILSQRYENLELILINDGSTDRSFSICEDYAQRDSRVKVISQPNGGISVARNRGIEAATGDYIVFVDGDDWIEGNFLERMVTVHEETGSDVTICNYTAFNQENTIFSFYVSPEDSYVKIFTPNEWFQHIYGIENHSTCFVVAWGKIYNKCLFEKLLYPAGKIAEDDYSTYFTYLQADKITYVNEGLYIYRIHPNSITTSNKLLDRIPLRSIEEEFTMMTLLGLDTTAISRIFIVRLKMLKKACLLDGKVDDYKHICLMLDILKKHGVVTDE
ncbi:glycosyltransferase family 2 protein [Butyrivibrio sp. NC2007]|uniref:glycosyltransferase family 2 protein n=1 Tax=Butyrivibrio sp. NC2007 TaxID=1280683 RepID=UPI0003B73D60|nr:glycosyltransferase [Butyrivibrio sp. NC2007]